MNDIVRSFKDDIALVATKLRSAEAILVGAGAGLSAAAGLLYNDTMTFRSWFPGYAERYGLRNIYEAAFFDFPSPEEYYAYWARHIWKIRYRQPAGDPYLKLLGLLRDKEYFVVSTNVDGQFLKAGFDPARLYTPQGNYGYFQCAKPCSEELYDNEAFVRGLAEKLPEDSFSIDRADIPRCPNCGEALVPNIRKDDRFAEGYWEEGFVAYQQFARSAVNKELLLIELGVGFNTPSIIRFPFEYIATKWENAFLVRVNLSDPSLAIASARQSFLPFQIDIAFFLEAIARSRTELGL